MKAGMSHDTMITSPTEEVVVVDGDEVAADLFDWLITQLYIGVTYLQVY